MDLGNMPKNGGNLLFSAEDADEAVKIEPVIGRYIFDFVGSQEFVKGIVRKCMWIEDSQADEAAASLHCSSPCRCTSDAFG